MRYYGVDPKSDLFALQAMRSSHPGLISRCHERRAVFGAALEQFEALHHATRSVSPAAAPITLFYSLSQAGRALAAAKVPGEAGWRSTGHGLSIRGDANNHLGDLIVKPDSKKQTSFALFCQAIGSEPLTAPVKLSALWGAAYGFRNVDGLGAGFPEPTPIVELPTAGRLFSLEGPIARNLPDDLDAATLELTNRLSQFQVDPTGISVTQVVRPDQTSSSPGVHFTWETTDGSARNLDELAITMTPAAHTGRLLVPKLGPKQDVPHPFAVIYACLLALSSAARYWPEMWQRSLNRDLTSVAIAVEEAIDHLLEILPFYVRSFLAETPFE